jgi:hypothetical protein
MNTSKSTKTSKSNPSSFAGISLNGDLAEAFSEAKKSLQAAGHGTAKLGEVFVSISVKQMMGAGKDDPGNPHPNRDDNAPSKSTLKSMPSFTGVSPNGNLDEAFAKAKLSLQTAGRGTGKLGEVSVTISLKPMMGVGKDDPGNPHPNRDLPST